MLIGTEGCFQELMFCCPESADRRMRNTIEMMSWRLRACGDLQ